jgi:hypothetical protein
VKMVALELKIAKCREKVTVESAVLIWVLRAGSCTPGLSLYLYHSLVLSPPSICYF